MRARLKYDCVVGVPDVRLRIGLRAHVGALFDGLGVVLLAQLRARAGLIFASDALAVRPDPQDAAAHVPRDVPMVIVGGTGLYFSALLRGLDRRWEKPPPEYPVIRIDRAVVRARIAARLDGMFMDGLEEEKRRLRAEYPVWSRTASLAIGYREGDGRDKILTRTCQLAKRQDTWFRHQATPLYVEPTAESVRRCWRERGPWKVAF